MAGNNLVPKPAAVITVFLIMGFCLNSSTSFGEVIIAVEASVLWVEIITVTNVERWLGLCRRNRWS